MIEMADRRGTSAREMLADYLSASMSKRSVVTVEKIVEDFKDVHPNACVLPSWTITAIAHVPGGAHPSYAHGIYKRDNAAYLDWDEISADRGRFRDWMERNVLSVGPEIFAERVKGR
jgi:glutaconate CoA-transferase subunit A